MITRKAILVLSVLLLDRQMYAQSACDNALYEADKLYEAGKFQECVQLLKPCLGKLRGQEYKLQSFRLMALSYMNLNDDRSARENVRKMLKIKPDYQKFSNVDPLAFSRLVSGFQVTPKLIGGFTFGFNINSVSLNQSYSTYTSAQRYIPSAGYQLGLGGRYILGRQFSIASEFLFSGVSVKHVIDDAAGWEKHIREQQKYLGLQMSVVKNFPLRGRVSLYAGLGFGAARMNKADLSVESVNSETQIIQQDSRNAVNERNRLQMSVLGRSGISFQMGTGIFSLDASVSLYFKNTVNSEKRMDDLNFIINNQYINDDISLRLFALNVHYQIPIIWKIKEGK